MGRPREYDEDALLSLAMNAFWSRGYRGTSVEALVSESGVSRGSLYSAYPGKRRLFIESLQHYLDDVVANNVRRLNDVEPAAEAIRQFFLQLVEAPPARLRRGCLLTNTAAEVGLKNKEAAVLIRRALKRVEDALYKRLVEAQKAGELAGEIDPRAYARQLITLIQGIRVMARVDVGRDTFRGAIKMALYPLVPRRASRTVSRKGPARSSAGASKNPVS